MTNLSSGGEGLESESGDSVVPSPNRERFPFFALSEMTGDKAVSHAGPSNRVSTLRDRTGAMDNLEAKFIWCNIVCEFVEDMYIEPFQVQG